MPTMKLTDAFLRMLDPKRGERVEYFDATLPGFGLRVSGPTPKNPRGRKSWVVFYRVRGVQRRATLDKPYPELKLKEARIEAGKIFEDVVNGVDPKGEPSVTATTDRGPETFGAVAEAFLAIGMVSGTGRLHAPRYLAEIDRNLRNHVLPRWADRDAGTITRFEVVSLLETVKAGKPARSADPPAERDRKIGGPIAANRVLSVLRPLFFWASDTGRIAENPCLKVKRMGEEVKGTRTLGADELREVWFELAELGYPFGTFLQTVLVTAQRRTAVARMRWSSLDFQARTWTLTASENKSNRGLIVPLSTLAVELITADPAEDVQRRRRADPEPLRVHHRRQGADQWLLPGQARDRREARQGSGGDGGRSDPGLADPRFATDRRDRDGWPGRHQRRHREGPRSCAPDGHRPDLQPCRVHAAEAAGARSVGRPSSGSDDIPRSRQDPKILR